jgi:hypothetical protein
VELSKFVQEVLSEVVAGVRAAQEGAQGAFIVPSGVGGHVYAANTRVAVSARLKSTIVDFDIAVTAEDTIKGGAEGASESSGSVRRRMATCYRRISS